MSAITHVYQRYGKRLADIVLSLSGLIVLFPLLMLLSVVLLLVQGRPLFFSQSRVGRHFTMFKLHKFRSMRPSTAIIEAGFAPQQQDRRTGIGRFLRASKLDELPQLWNVLRGDMSLVGPRPEVPQWIDSQCQQWQIALSVRPGITDNASLIFFDEEEQLNLSASPEALYAEEILPEKLRLACYYAHNVTLQGDVSIALKTITLLIRH
ncbi:MAG: sugar transferase [Granulosicoccus sp.]